MGSTVDTTCPPSTAEGGGVQLAEIPAAALPAAEIKSVEKPLQTNQSE